MGKKLFILRHGETEYNRRNIMQGRGVDSSLNDTGRRQSELFYNAYESRSFDVVVTSSLKRSIQTVQPFIDGGTSWKEREELDEIHWGKFEGDEYHDQLTEAYRQMVEHWSAGKVDARLEGGESARDLTDRLDRFLREMKEWPHKRILICSHGRTIRCLLCRLQNLELHHMESVSHSNTGLYQLKEGEEHYRLIKANCTDHLESVAL